MKAHRSITILHLSDPQFGRNHRFGNLGSAEHSDSVDTLFERVSADLNVLEKEGVKPELIVVSGDLAEWAKKNEFQDALEFLINLSKRCSVPRDHVIIVPGNHDINRSLTESYFKQCEGEDENPVYPYWIKWKHYKWLFQEFYQDSLSVNFTVEVPWTFWEFADLSVVVAGLNSTMNESHLPGSHHGFVGEKQLIWFAERLSQYRQQGWLRIGVVHHNVERGAVADDENLRDADDLKRLLGPELNLLLHGHTHNSKISWLSPHTPVLATGSAALTLKARPREVPNQYQALRLWTDKLERWTRLYDAEQKRWIGDTRCSDTGNEWHVVHSVSLESVNSTFGTASMPKESPEDLGENLERPNWSTTVKYEDLLSRVAELCSLRYRNAEVEIPESTGSRPDYLRVRLRTPAGARVFPVAVLDRSPLEDDVNHFYQEVFAQYRALDPTLPCEIVYSGKRAPDELLRRASARGILLRSFLEFQGIIDFSSYVERQNQKLSSDVIYPPKLYVPQALTYEIGQDSYDSTDACSEIVAWMQEPLARFVLVLGDFGAGKTFLLHEVAQRLSKEASHLVPMLIELRLLEKARTFEQLIAQHLASCEERYIDLAAFPYMLREGRIALLFDGFDELAQRVTYQRATEHFETLLQAAAGQAKIVVTSRTQHFESDEQIKTALYERTEMLPGLRLARLQSFNDSQILSFLQNLLGDAKAAARRFDLIREIHDLLGLSHNPRMLSFIANLPEEDLREAQKKTGGITAAELYRLLIERWLTFEYERTQPRGAAPTLSVEERWKAVTAVALSLWPKLDRTIRLAELTEEVARNVDRLTDKQLDLNTAAHLVGSGTLLIRDESGTFAFVHQSVMEWLVANAAARELKSNQSPNVLSIREMSALMVDFFSDLAGHVEASKWAKATLSSTLRDQSPAKSNALLVLAKLGEDAGGGTTLAGQDLRGKQLSRQQLSGANFVKADLTEARLEETDLRNADLSGGIVDRADLTRANLSEANLEGASFRGAKLLGADLRNARIKNANFRRAKLTGAQISPEAFDGAELFGAAAIQPTQIEAMHSWPSPSLCVAASCDDIIAMGRDDGSVLLRDAFSGKEVRIFRAHPRRIWSLAFSPDGKQLATTGSDSTVRI